MAQGSYLPSVHTNLFGEAEDGDWISFRTPFGFDEVDFPGYSGFGYVILRNNSQVRELAIKIIELHIFLDVDIAEFFDQESNEIPSGHLLRIGGIDVESNSSLFRRARRRGTERGNFSRSIQST